MPDGNRVLPAPGGGIRLQPDPLNIGQPNLPETPVVSPTSARDCPICLESKPDFRMINPGCGHLICFRCAQGMVSAAVGNVTTNIPIKCPMSGNGCEKLITPYTEGIRPLLTARDYEKFERYHILKIYVPTNRLRYCPNSTCGMPFEVNDDIIDEVTSPPRQVNFRLSTCCSECDTLICIYCNDFAHPNISCREFQERQKTDQRPHQSILRITVKNVQCARLTCRNNKHQNKNIMRERLVWQEELVNVIM